MLNATESLGRFEKFVGNLKDLYGVDLPMPTFHNDLNRLKKFCTGLIEGEKDHLWKTAVSSLSARSRAGIAHSLFLFRKVIPGEKPSVADYVDRMAQAQERPDPEFLSYAQKLTRNLFRIGWDSAYCRSSVTSCLSQSACAEDRRKAGGGRGIDVQRRWMHSEFCAYVLTGARSLPRCASRVCVTESGGKWRVVSSSPRVDNALRPLHTVMYNHLSRFKWLLRGDAKPTSFKDFNRVDGEIFLSGDYESATDNLNSVLQRAILDELLQQSTRIPEGIKEHALSLYDEPLLSYGDEPWMVRHQRRGQLMGNLTSFPLLCLVNYITFRYCTRGCPRIPVRINGDDIVFRATPDVVSRWERGVAAGGLVLSVGKTLKSPRFFTLNSALFEGNASKGSRGVGFVRPRACWSSTSVAEQVMSLNSRFYSYSVGMGRERTRVAREFFVRQNERFVHASRRSTTRGLGLSLDRHMLQRVGLWHRELYYLEQDLEPPLPVMRTGGVPEGFVQVSKHRVSPDMVREGESRFGAALVHSNWHDPYDPKESDVDELMRAIREGCSPYGINHFKGLAKVRRMLRLSRSQCWQWCNIRRNASVFGRVRMQKEKRVWVALDMLEGLSVHIEFVKALSVR
jgi:hypothetical protein